MMTKTKAKMATTNGDATVDPVTPPEATEPTQPGLFRPGSKLAALVERLQATEGATLEELMGATGWQAHSVRGAMAGALKTRGLIVTSARVEERGRVYHLAAADASVIAAAVTAGSALDAPAA